MTQEPQEPTTPETPPETPPEEGAEPVETTGGTVDASVDPNLGHAIEDQKLGVGTGPSQTSADTERESDGGDVSEAV